MAKSKIEKLSENLEKTTKRAPFRVEKDKKYLIKERINSGTPSGLKEFHRSKMGGGFSEPIPIPFSNGRYDTGLNKYSSEFKSKSAAKKAKILEERQDLIDHLNFLVESSGKTETEFLQGIDGELLFRLVASHGLILDTSNSDTYLKLFLAMRGNYIMPLTEKGDEGKYAAAMYQIEGVSEQEEDKGNKALMTGEVIEWFMKNYDNNKSTVEKTLVYVDILPVNQTKSKGILLQTVQKAIESFEKLEDLHYTINNVSQEEINMLHSVKKAKQKGLIKYQKGNFYYEAEYLAPTLKGVVAKLQTPDFVTIGEKIFNIK